MAKQERQLILMSRENMPKNGIMVSQVNYEKDGKFYGNMIFSDPQHSVASEFMAMGAIRMANKLNNKDAILYLHPSNKFWKEIES